MKKGVYLGQLGPATTLLCVNSTKTSYWILIKGKTVKTEKKEGFLRFYRNRKKPKLWTGIIPVDVPSSISPTLLPAAKQGEPGHAFSLAALYPARRLRTDPSQ